VPSVGGDAKRSANDDPGQVVTVSGLVPPGKLGTVLAHEHVLVDFVGADKVDRKRYDAEDAFRTILPHLKGVREAGCDTLVECTPAYLGRDPALLRRLGEASGLRFLTNTGYYGAGDDRYVPAHAYRESAAELARRWTAEFEDGIEGTGIRPGFIKTGVDPGPLSAIDRKLVEAAALCHERTGLTIYVHTGDGRAALDTMAVLKAARLGLDAYVWVHAQNEKDRALHVRAAEEGAWVSFDGVGPESLNAHVEAVLDMARRGHLGRLLVSQDAGWYRVGEPGGGAYRDHTFLFDSFLPALRSRGFSEAQVRTLLITNPAAALGVRVRKAG
jgi:phosphotriesterase-related protein